MGPVGSLGSSVGYPKSGLKCFLGGPSSYRYGYQELPAPTGGLPGVGFSGYSTPGEDPGGRVRTPKMGA